MTILRVCLKKKKNCLNFTLVLECEQSASLFLSQGWSLSPWALLEHPNSSSDSHWVPAPCCLLTKLCLTLCDPARLLCPWDFPDEYWSGLPFPSPLIFPTQIELRSPASPALAGKFFTTELPGQPEALLTDSRKELSLPRALGQPPE